MPKYDFSNGFKRLKDARLGAGDKVPVVAQYHEFAMQWKGVSAKEFYTSPPVFVEACLDTALEFQLDVPDMCWDAYNLEAEALGVKVLFHEDQTPALERSAPLVQNEKDLARLKAPDPFATGRMPFALECLKIHKELTGVSAPLTFCAPFSLAVLVMGYDQLVAAVYENPDFVRKVLDFLTDEVIAPYIRAAFSRDPDCPGADGSDALSSLPFVTLDMLAEFSIPYIQRLTQQVDSRIYVRNWWGDSYVKDVESFWDQKMRVSGGVLEVQDPDLNKIGPERVAAYAKPGRLPLIFGVDQTLLAKGDAHQVAQRVRQYVETGGRQKRLVLYLCNLSRVTPEENVKAAVDAVTRFGTFG